MPPLKEWAHEAAIDEFARVAKRFRREDFDRDVRPRLARLTREQLAMVEAGLLARDAGRDGAMRGPAFVNDLPWRLKRRLGPQPASNFVVRGTLRQPPPED